MKTTRILELKSQEAVKQFCETIIRLKKEAPCSLNLTVALTTEQCTVTVVPPSMAHYHQQYVGGDHHVDVELTKLEQLLRGQEPRKQPVVTVATRQGNKRPRTPRPRRRARPVLKSVW